MTPLEDEADLFAGQGAGHRPGVLGYSGLPSPELQLRNLSGFIPVKKFPCCFNLEAVLNIRFKLCHLLLGDWTIFLSIIPIQLADLVGVLVMD